jgi:uncharacterized Zn-finger protein
VNAAGPSTATAEPAIPLPRPVTAADLPLCCPMPGTALWNTHPRVYLSIGTTGQAKCPYCSAEYVLQR